MVYLAMMYSNFAGQRINPRDEKFILDRKFKL